MKCPACNQNIGGRTFGDEKEKFRSLLYVAMLEGEAASIENPDLNFDDSPYDSIKDPALFFAWMHGAYYVKFRRVEDPLKFLEKSKEFLNRLSLEKK